MSEKGKSDEYKYNIENAKKYGTYEAIVLYNIIFWVSLDAAKGRGFRKGRYWMYCSVNQFVREFHPDFTVSKMRTTLNSLINQKVIFKRDFNVHNYSNPSWYTVVDKSMMRKDFKIAKDKLDVMKRDALKRFIKKYALEINISDLHDSQIKDQIRKHPEYKENLENDMQLEFPDAKDDWYTEGDADDELFADEKDEFDEMSIDRIMKLARAKNIKLKITDDMDIDDVRNEIRWLMYLKSTK